jgi:hypothetical protein
MREGLDTCRTILLVTCREMINVISCVVAIYMIECCWRQLESA